MGKSIRLEGVILGSRDLGESDLLITLFTRELGKLKAVAKGAKRSKRRFLNALEPFTVIAGNFAPPRADGALYRIDSADIVEKFETIGACSESYCLASLVCELTDLWSKEEDPDKALYSLVLQTLAALFNGNTPYGSILGFKLHLLRYAGYKLGIGQCVNCKSGLEAPQIHFSIERGGAVCAACADGQKDMIKISMGALKSLRFYQRSHAANFGRLCLAPELFEEIWNLLAQFNIYYLRKSPSSYKVLADFLDFKRVKSVG